MVNNRRGSGRLGCLFSLLIVAVVCYYGIPMVRVYWDYYRLVDEMQANARFAETMTDEEILRRLRRTVDDLDLPAETKRFVIRRTKLPRSISIRTQYHEVLELPFHHKALVLRPSVSVDLW